MTPIADDVIFYEHDEPLQHVGVEAVREVQADGKLVAAGMGFGADVALARYNPDGSLDSSFGTDGKGHPIGATGMAQCARLALQHNIELAAAAVVTLYEKVG
jgi:acetyl-CoA acetyltransferase